MALFNMAVIYKKLNVLYKSKVYYERAIEKNLGYPYSFLNLAIIYKDEGKIDKAIEILSRGIKFNPDCEFLFYNRSCFNALKGEIGCAIDDLIKAVELYPKFIDYIKKDNELEMVRESLKFKEYVKSNYGL